MMNEQLVLEGSVENVIYKNDENGYVVFNFLSEEELVCVGNIAYLNEGEHLKVTGSFVVHSIYGKQFQVKAAEKIMPDTAHSMEKYLGSGIIKGVGVKLAKRVVSHFGDATFKIIEEHPLKLAEIKGVSQKKALLIGESYNRHIALKNLILFLQDLDISTSHAIKIYELYKENAIDTVKTNPYKLSDDVIGIGFKTADAIAEKLGVEKNSVYRIKAGIKYILSSWTLSGHTFTPKHSLIKQCASVLAVNTELISGALTELQLESQIIQKVVESEDAVYLSYLLHAENYCAKKISHLDTKALKTAAEDICATIDAFEADSGITLAEKQKEAITEALNRNILVITGGPGTGKTTTINAIIYVLKKNGKSVVLAAPTGRAAKRMSEATGVNAQTIHRLLETTFTAKEGTRQKFEKNEENPLECDAVIIDETSMVDILLFNSLLKAITVGTKLILVGDSDQLPSVGAGNVLTDIIKSGCVKVVLLNEIFRQARLSAIVMNAHKINKGVFPTFNEKGSDFFFMKRTNTAAVIETIQELVTKRLPSYLGSEITKDIQILTPMRKSALGSYELNKVLQHTLNPPSPQKKERELRLNTFREGDKVMQIKNNYNISWVVKDDKEVFRDEGTGIFNGDQGYITQIDEEDESITVLFDDGKEVIYNYSNIDELELSYAITIHKSQGSEYSVIIVPVLSGPYMLMTRNLLYTAVTRAKTLVVLVGAEEKVNEMVLNNTEVKRYSGLKESIIKAFSKMP